MMKFQNLLYKIDLHCSYTGNLLSARGCESHGFFLYLRRVPYFLHPRHSSFFKTFAMEIKALGQCTLSITRR